MGRYLVAWCALWFVAGIACVAVSEAAALFAAITILFALITSRLPPPARTRGLIAALAFACGTLDASIRGHARQVEADTHFTRFRATVVDARQSDVFGTTLTLLMPDGASALTEISGGGVEIGTRVVVRGKREPFDDARNPGEPSQRILENERGVTERLASATILSRAPPDASDPRLWIPRARAWASARLHAALPEPEATVLAGAMWGERGALAPELRAEFQDTGTVHVLVTAGLHLGVVAALVLGSLRAFGCGRIAACLVTIGCLWLYAALSGDHLPSQRAATMLSFGLVAHACGREALSWNVLGAAALVIAAWEPATVTGISFLLSFSCVAAIIAFARSFAERLQNTLPHLVAEAAAVSLATQLGTWPLTAAAFLVIAPYAPLANLAVVPVVGVAMLAGFATLAAAPIPLVATACANVATSLVDWILGCVRTIAGLSGSAIVATPPPAWTIAAYDCALVALALALSKKRAIATAVVVAACAAALCLWPPRPARTGLTITAIDVGQADALLVQTPRGHAYLVDAGGKLERGTSSGAEGAAEAVGERIVAPYLIRAGIHHLDAVLLSHPHGEQ